MTRIHVIFRDRELGEGAFWWRRELQARAGLEWDGRKFIDGDVRWLMRTCGDPSLPTHPSPSQADPDTPVKGGE